MSFALVNGQTWNMGYLYISLIQVALTVIIMLSLPLWKKPFIINDIQEVDVGNEKNKADSDRSITYYGTQCVYSLRK